VSKALSELATRQEFREGDLINNEEGEQIEFKAALQTGDDLLRRIKKHALR